MSIYNLYMTIYNRRSETRPALPRNETTAQILALLSGIAGNELHTNEIIRRVNGNPRAVQRALVNSEAGGLITSRRIGNLRLWRMDPTSPLYESMRELFGRTRGVPAKLASVLAKSRGVRVAFLFGSYATATVICFTAAGAPEEASLAGPAEPLGLEAPQPAAITAVASTMATICFTDRLPLLSRSAPMRLVSEPRGS